MYFKKELLIVNHVKFDIEILVNFDCTTTGYFLPFFSSLQKKREEEKENEVAKPFFLNSPNIIYKECNY